MKKIYYLIILTVILGLVLTGCFLSNVGQVPTSGQSGITYLTKGPYSGLVGLWHFDGDALDSSGNLNHGSLMGDTSWTSGKFGNALSFDGSGDYVDFGSGVTGLITGDYTVEAWIKPASLDSGRHAVMSFSYMELGHNAGKVYFWQAYDNSWGKGYKYISSSVLLDVNKFSHIVGVFHEDAGVDLYVNGNWIGSDTTKTGATLNIFGKTYAGVWYQMPPVGPGGAWFDGTIDEVRIWNEALNSTQIGQSYNLSANTTGVTELSHQDLSDDGVAIFTSAFYIGRDPTLTDTLEARTMIVGSLATVDGWTERKITPRGSVTYTPSIVTDGVDITVFDFSGGAKSLHLTMDLSIGEGLGFNVQFLPYD